MTKTNSNQPADTVRYGSLKGTIWANPGKDGRPPRFSVTYTRGYKTDEGWKETSSLGEIDNLKLRLLTDRVAIRIIELKAEEAAESDEYNTEEGGQ